MLRSDTLLIYAANKGSYLASSDGSVAFNDDLALPFEASKTYRLRVVKYVYSS